MSPSGTPWARGTNAKVLVDSEINGGVSHIYLGAYTPRQYVPSYGAPYTPNLTPTYTSTPLPPTFAPTTSDLFKDYTPPTTDSNNLYDLIKPGPDNASYKTSLERWKQSDPEGAAEFEKNISEGLNGQDRKEWIVNNLQTAIYEGKISKSRTEN